MDLVSLEFAKDLEFMKINIEKINKIITVLIVLIVVIAGVACIWLNAPQRMVVGIGTVFAIINLLGMRFFFNKNNGRRKR